MLPTGSPTKFKKNIRRVAAQMGIYSQEVMQLHNSTIIECAWRTYKMFTSTYRYYRSRSLPILPPSRLSLLKSTIAHICSWGMTLSINVLEAHCPPHNIVPPQTWSQTKELGCDWTADLTSLGISKMNHNYLSYLVVYHNEVDCWVVELSPILASIAS